MPTKLWCVLLWLCAAAALYGGFWLIGTGFDLPLWLKVGNTIVGVFLLYGAVNLHMTAIFMWE
jgi:putative effector of murein hydrolase LrgA (UPF0299 family)